MTLVFTLLRKDHIIFASDSLHVRGTAEGRYKNENAWKVEPILKGYGLLGFAGQDYAEEIVREAKRNGTFQKSSLRATVAGIESIKESLYTSDQRLNMNVQFLLAGFEDGIAKSVEMRGPIIPIPCSYDEKSDNFQIIGVREHGALYVLRKCAADCLNIEAGIRLAYFALAEVGKYEIRVDGIRQVYAIRPGQPAEIDKSAEAHTRWAEEVGERIRTLIVSPKSSESDPRRSKRDRSIRPASRE